MTTLTANDHKETTVGQWELLDKLSLDMCEAAKLMGQREIRYLVDQYYVIQENRKAAKNQVRSAEDEPNAVIDWVFESTRRLESNIQRALGAFALSYRVGEWMQSICGIGPCISAGLMSHLDIRKAKTFGHFSRFAGLDPTCKWEKKTKRPWNAKLKTLVTFHAGECFVRTKGNAKSYYGQFYDDRKVYESEKNDNHEFRSQAEAILKEKNFGKETDARKWYEQGKLPPAHIHARCRRYMSKLFLSHVHHVMYVDYYGKEPPVPYVFEHSDKDHRHYIAPPNWPMESDKRSLRDLLVEPLPPVNEDKLIE